MSKDHPIGTLTSDFDTTKKRKKTNMPEKDLVEPVEASASDKKQQQER